MGFETYIFCKKWHPFLKLNFQKKLLENHGYHVHRFAEKITLSL